MYNQGLVDSATGLSNSQREIEEKLNEIEDKIDWLQKIFNLKKLNSKENKKELCNFINDNTKNWNKFYPFVKKVTSVRLKEEDDENGMANEHYIVECVLFLQPACEVNRNCLVDVLQYKMWLKHKNAIKWV